MPLPPMFTAGVVADCSPPLLPPTRCCRRRWSCLVPTTALAGMCWKRWWWAAPARQSSQAAASASCDAAYMHARMLSCKANVCRTPVAEVPTPRGVREVQARAWRGARMPPSAATQRAAARCSIIMSALWQLVPAGFCVQLYLWALAAASSLEAASDTLALTLRPARCDHGASTQRILHLGAVGEQERRLQGRP